MKNETNQRFKWVVFGLVIMGITIAVAAYLVTNSGVLVATTAAGTAVAVADAARRRKEAEAKAKREREFTLQHLEKTRREAERNRENLDAQPGEVADLSDEEALNEGEARFGGEG